MKQHLRHREPQEVLASSAQFLEQLDEVLGNRVPMAERVEALLQSAAPAVRGYFSHNLKMWARDAGLPFDARDSCGRESCEICSEDEDDRHDLFEPLFCFNHPADVDALAYMRTYMGANYNARSHWFESPHEGDPE